MESSVQVIYIRFTTGFILKEAVVIRDSVKPHRYKNGDVSACKYIVITGSYCERYKNCGA